MGASRQPNGPNRDYIPCPTRVVAHSSRGAWCPATPRTGARDEQFRLVSCSLLAVDLSASELQSKITASTAGYCLPQPFPSQPWRRDCFHAAFAHSPPSVIK